MSLLSVTWRRESDSDVPAGGCVPDVVLLGVDPQFLDRGPDVLGPDELAAVRGPLAVSEREYLPPPVVGGAERLGDEFDHEAAVALRIQREEGAAVVLADGVARSSSPVAISGIRSPSI
ncbi:hypothetical protein BRD13_06640 [Halobacteriales archaeon SW_5_70_135]|nr:MAG: hypothetical protein BRD13_06640 [Halobacteriales archaeon SW_5_70_135]